MRQGQSILSEQHWQSLRSSLDTQGIQALVFASEFPVVDDAPEDAQRKSLNPTRRFLRQRWPYHEAEVLRLLESIFGWRDAGVADARRAVILSGGLRVGVKSKIVHANYSDDELVQLCCPRESNCRAPSRPALTGRRGLLCSALLCSAALCSALLWTSVPNSCVPKLQLNTANALRPLSCHRQAAKV